MFKHILVATDGSRLSLKAVRTAARLAADHGANLTAIYVLPVYVPPVYGEAAMYMPAMSPRTFKEAADVEAQGALAQVAKAAEANDIQCKSMKVADNQPWNAIVKAARAKKCDLIVMASHGRRGLAGLVLGSETTKVLTHTKVPVLVCR